MPELGYAGTQYRFISFACRQVLTDALHQLFGARFQQARPVFLRLRHAADEPGQICVLFEMRAVGAARFRFGFPVQESHVNRPQHFLRPECKLLVPVFL